MEALSSLSIEDQMVVGAFYDPQMLLHKNHDDEDHVERPERIEAIHKNLVDK